MKGFVYIDNSLIGSVDFQIIDEGMGCIGGYMIPETAYQNYQSRVQKLYEEKGIANIEDFNFRIVLENRSVLEPMGGIGIIDSADDDEIYVDAAGIDLTSLKH